MAKNNQLNPFEGPYAIVRVSGQQLRVFPGQTITVNKLEGNLGDMVSFSEVLLLGEIANSESKEAAAASAPMIGTPLISGASVKAKIVAQDKGEKVIIYKKKRRTGYTKSQGHRQLETTLKIEEIIAGR